RLIGALYRSMVCDFRPARFTGVFRGGRVASPTEPITGRLQMATTAGTRAGAFDSDLEDFRAQLRGTALTPSDPEYGDVREVFNAMHTGKPDLIVSCTGTADVVDAVNFAREH